MEQTRKKPVQQSRNVRPRRKKRRAPIRELAICAAVIFVAGFLVGFLVRGAFLPREEKPAETTQPPVETTTEPKTQPPVPLDDWRLVLVNPANPLPESCTASMTRLSDGHEVDKRCYSDLQAMLDACEAAGLYPRLESAYRTWEEQDKCISEEIDRLVEEGMSHAKAEKEAAKRIAVPGCSEHHLGLAVDLADKDAQQWLQEHSWEHGFILRYPGDKVEQTGYAYDPGHYRYVGREAAKEMWESGLCLEEYLAQYQ